MPRHQGLHAVHVTFALTGGAAASVEAVVFLCGLAARATLSALAPVLRDVADELGVSTAAAGRSARSRRSWPP